MLSRVLRSFLDVGQIALDCRFQLPLNRPFTHGAARKAGLQSRDLSMLVTEGFLRRLVAGVYVANQVPDSLALRAQALRLVVPQDAVVTDRTAGWLHGAPMVLAPGDHLVIPQVSMFVNRKGARLRNEFASSGERTLKSEDVTEVLGVRVTSALRTACDLGRLLNRDGRSPRSTRCSLWVSSTPTSVGRGQAIPRDARSTPAARVRPLADGRAQSAAESILRLRWLDLLTLPRPEPQIEVLRPGQPSYWLDLGVRTSATPRSTTVRSGTGGLPSKARDASRRTWIREERGWIIDVVTKDNLFGHTRDIEGILLNGVREARRRL